ncbi:MAG: hypothetical protein PHR06_03380 [Candidatus Cloacimonetes bacterium]|nr:hypothetical protein [Candidatus Cloacimonadota bacterium]
MNIKIVIVSILTAFSIFSLHSITEEKAKKFINLLIIDSPEISDFLDIDDVENNSRLGTNYYGVQNKSLISYDIDPEIKKLILNKQLEYEIRLEFLEAQYYLLTFRTQKPSYEKEFFFYGDNFVSPLTYKSRNWKTIESNFFRFIISEQEFFNEYSIVTLESFLSHMFETLKFTEKEIELLRTQKIEYIFCRNEIEIEDLTGFNTRGIYILASDTIVTTFNCHYHELVHLLVNYKLKKLNLYTHPLFLEGIAVALGGRGGKEPYIINDIGYFLVDGEFLSYPDLLSSDVFYHYDVSLNYPVSGLYAAFLIKTIGIENYLDLYAKHGSPTPDIIKIHPMDLPEDRLWRDYLDSYSVHEGITLESIDSGTELFRDENTLIREDNHYLFFKTKASNIFLKNPVSNNDFISKKFVDSFPDKEYKGEKYLISVNSNEINIYNLFSNNLIAAYVQSFDHECRPIPFENGCYIFSVSKKLFDENLQEMTIYSF